MKKWIIAIVSSIVINLIIFSGVALYMTLFKAEPMEKHEEITLSFVEDQGGASGGAPQVSAPKPQKVDIPAPLTAEQVQQIKDGVAVDSVLTPAPTTASPTTSQTSTDPNGNSKGPGGTNEQEGDLQRPGPDKPPGESRRPIPISVSEPTIPKSSLNNQNWSGGRATVAYTIGTDGSIVSVELLASSGDEAADQAAINAAWSWSFEPALDNGVPVQYSGKKSIRIDIS